MAKLNNYKGSIELLSGLRPKNNKDFPLMQAHDIQVDENGTRLDEVLENIAVGGAGDATIYEGTVTATEVWEDWGSNKLRDLGVTLSLTQGATYIVELNDKSYKCVHGVSSVGSYPYLGNPKLLHSENTDTGEPFCLMLASHATYLVTEAAENYTLKIKEVIGSTCSWNDLEDKPFYDETYTGTMSFQYDGDSTGTITIDLGDEGTLVKISDWTTTPEYLIGATTVMNGHTIVLKEEDITDLRSRGYPVLLVGQACFMAFEPFVDEGVVFPEPGTYIFDNGTVGSLTYTGVSTKIHPIPKKYLPAMTPASSNTGNSAVGNVHIIDIGDQDLNIEDLDFAAYNEGDVLLIIQNEGQA